MKKAFLLLAAAAFASAVKFRDHADDVTKKPVHKRRIYYFRGMTGFGNQQLQFESMVAMAAVFDRELMIPPKSPMEHVGESWVETAVYDENALGRVIKFDIRGQSDAWCPNGAYQHPGERITSIQINALPQDRDWCFGQMESEVTNFECLQMFTPDQKKIAQLAVFNGIQFQDQWIEKAMHKLQRLGLRPGNYVAAHMRRGDSVDGSHGHFSEWNLEDNYGLLNSLLKEKANHVPLLVATDAKDSRGMIQNLQTHTGASRVLLADDAAQGSMMERVLTDILMCSMAGTFVGTSASTFSTMIFTMRARIQKCRQKKQGFLTSGPLGSSEVAWFNGDLNRFHMLGKEDRPGQPSVNHAQEGETCNWSFHDNHRARLVTLNSTGSDTVCKLDASIP